MCTVQWLNYLSLGPKDEKFTFDGTPLLSLTWSKGCPGHLKTSWTAELNCIISAGTVLCSRDGIAEMSYFGVWETVFIVIQQWNIL